MKYEVTILVDSEYREKIDLELYKQCAVEVLEIEKADPGILSLVFTDQQHIHSLNLEYAGVDEPTDVLSFANGDIDPSTDRIFFGDVIIAVPVAEANASSDNRELEEELALLIIHGVLHLLGYDHASPEDERVMWDRQSAILADLGIRNE
jgi:probable rRNA maturation factor